MKQRKVQILTHSDNEIQEILNEFKKESDRATVILGAAKLDAQLYLLLSKFLKPSINSQDDLLDGDNPLGTLSSKINISYRLGLIDSHFAKSLHLIRKIRNSFAHEFKTLSLSTGGHADRVRELVVHFKDYVGYQDYKEEQYGNENNLANDFRIILAVAIIRTDTAIHYCNTISTEGVVLIPPVWKRKLKANDQKPPRKKSVKKKNMPKKSL